MKRSSSALSSLFTSSSLKQSPSSNHDPPTAAIGGKQPEPIVGPCKTYPPDPKRYTLMEIIGHGCSSTVNLPKSGRRTPGSRSRWHASYAIVKGGWAGGLGSPESPVATNFNVPVHTPNAKATTSHFKLLSLFLILYADFCHRLGADLTDLMREATAMKAYGGHPNVLPLHCAFGGIHRDVKASNVLIGERRSDGSIKLSDFGVAATMERMYSTVSDNETLISSHACIANGCIHQLGQLGPSITRA
eukprot:1157821-Pelagomonas_calceolata.AAC.3